MRCVCVWGGGGGVDSVFLEDWNLPDVCICYMDSVFLEDWNLDVCIYYMDSVFLFCFLLLPLFKFNVASRPQRP